MVVKAAEPDGSVTVLEWVQGFDWKAFVTGLKIHTLEHVGVRGGLRLEMTYGRRKRPPSWTKAPE